MSHHTTASILARTTHSARITGPIPYVRGDGKVARLPLGPCLVERVGSDQVDIVWGTQGQNSAALPYESVRDAADQGHLVLLD